MKVLVGDPDAQLVAVLSDTLRRLGHTVLVAHDGPQALAVWRAEAPDLVLLEDAHLPGLAGVVVTRTLRERDDRSPVILMSARPTEAAILRGLESGADDYLTKPISFRQLLARMQALRRRAAAPGRAPVTAVHGGGWDLDLTTKTVITPAGQAVALTPTECRLLALLLTNAGQTLPYARLVEACRGHAYEDATRLLKTHISRLRRKLRLATRGLQAIETVSGSAIAWSCPAPNRHARHGSSLRRRRLTQPPGGRCTTPALRAPYAPGRLPARHARQGPEPARRSVACRPRQPDDGQRPAAPAVASGQFRASEPTPRRRPRGRWPLDWQSHPPQGAGVALLPV